MIYGKMNFDGLFEAVNFNAYSCKLDSIGICIGDADERRSLD